MQERVAVDILKSEGVRIVNKLIQLVNFVKVGSNSSQN